MTYRLAILPGDGIGPEVMQGALDVLHVMAEASGISVKTSTWDVGGVAIEKHGNPLPDETLDACDGADAVLLGAVGGPLWDQLPPDQKPEKALLGLRKALGLFTNLRPAKVYRSLAGASSLKSDIVSGTDLIVVRELTGGIYFGEPRGIDDEHGWNTLVYHRSEVERIARVAFDLARKRSGNLTSVHKANVLESSHFWAQIVHEIQADYPDVSVTDMYIDNAAMQIVRDPRQFDIILTQNMFGDIISDLSAMVTGSMGMLPSASIGKNHALYEPVHGSAPDIAGEGVANPLAMIASVGMMFTSTFGLPEAERQLNASIERILDGGYRTADISREGDELVTTSEMAALVSENYSQSLTSAGAAESDYLNEEIITND